MTPLDDALVKRVIRTLQVEGGAATGQDGAPLGRVDRRLESFDMRKADISLLIFEAYLKLNGLGLEAGGWGEALRNLLATGLDASVKRSAKRASARKVAAPKPITQADRKALEKVLSQWRSK